MQEVGEKRGWLLSLGPATTHLPRDLSYCLRLLQKLGGTLFSRPYLFLVVLKYAVVEISGHKVTWRPITVFFSFPLVFCHKSTLPNMPKCPHCSPLLMKGILFSRPSPGFLEVSTEGLPALRVCFEEVETEGRWERQGSPFKAGLTSSCVNRQHEQAAEQAGETPSKSFANILGLLLHPVRCSEPRGTYLRSTVVSHRP